MTVTQKVGSSLCVTVLAGLCCNAPASACSASDGLPLAAAFQANPSLPSFTFDMDIALAMRHFPWLHFHMLGKGRYDRGKTYVVHFTQLPWFAPRPEHDADLAMLDTTMWPSRFAYQQTGEKDGDTLFDLHALDDPSLTKAIVGLGPKWCAREVQAAYSDGTSVDMNVNFGLVDGFMLPANLTADINEPHMALSANAEFKNYSFDFTAAATKS